MSGETEAIAKMAQRVSDDILSWFRWSRVPLPNQNFDCVKLAIHAPKKASHTHPVDAVFYYRDPYLDRTIYFNTDLKSYGKGSITAAPIFEALRSLGLTVDCAHASQEWKDRYEIESGATEVRGMLFVYNHDRDYDKDFYELLRSPIRRRGAKAEVAVKLETLPIASGQQLHIIEPLLISYLSTVIADANQLHAKGTFPEKRYEFYYPELKLHRTHGKNLERPATIEMLAGPYLIIRHECISKYNEETRSVEERYGEGYLIYYNRPGSSAEEFMYFLDILSGYQILDGTHKIRIRFAHHFPASDIKSNFKRAINAYTQEWGFDKNKLDRLNEIEADSVELTKASFSRQVIAWERT